MMRLAYCRKRMTCFGHRYAFEPGEVCALLYDDNARTKTPFGVRGGGTRGTLWLSEERFREHFAEYCAKTRAPITIAGREIPQGTVLQHYWIPRQEKPYVVYINNDTVCYSKDEFLLLFEVLVHGV